VTSRAIRGASMQGSLKKKRISQFKKAAK
jgi:hypothetical protein